MGGGGAESQILVATLKPNRYDMTLGHRYGTWYGLMGSWKGLEEDVEDWFGRRRMISLLGRSPRATFEACP